MPNPYMSPAKPEDIWAASNAQKKSQMAFGPPNPSISKPVDMSQGVESQAKAATPPASPIWNTSASDRTAALGRNTAIKPAAPAAASPLPRLSASPLPSSKSPLGGMDTRSLSERGPVKVGSSKPTGLRLLEQAARRRDPRAISQLAQIESNTRAGRNASWENQMFGQPAAPAATRPPSGAPDIFAAETAASPAADPNADFWASQDQQSADFQATQSKPAPEDKSPVDIYAMEGAGGYVPMVRNADGSSKAAGGFFPGSAPDPNALPALPSTPDQIATKAQAEEQFFTAQGLTLQPPEKATDSAGRTYARQQEPDQIAVNEAGKTMKIPPGFDAPEGFTFLKPKAAQPAAVAQPAKGQTASGNSYKRKA